MMEVFTLETLDAVYDRRAPNFGQPDLLIVHPKMYRHLRIVQRYAELVDSLPLFLEWLKKQDYRKLSRFLRKRAKKAWRRYCLDRAKFEVEEG